LKLSLSSLFILLDLICVALTWTCIKYFYSFLRSMNEDNKQSSDNMVRNNVVSIGGLLLFFHTVKALKFLRQSEKLAIITDLIFNIIQDLGPIALVYIVLITGCAFAMPLFVSEDPVGPYGPDDYSFIPR
jgi:hypothetical protein